MALLPIFQSIFAKHWPALPIVIHKHYANRPYTNDRVTVEGRMQVEMALILRLMSPILSITGVLVPYEGKDILVTVHFRSSPKDDSYTFDRIFYFPGKKPFHFCSHMKSVGGAEVVEWMRIGIGWHASYHYEDGKVILRHKRYVVRLFGWLVRLPLELLIGSSNAVEEALDDNTFGMQMDIRHALFGKVYSYSGVFKVTEVALDR